MVTYFCLLEAPHPISRRDGTPRKFCHRSTMAKMLAVLMLGMVASANAGAVELTAKNFDDQVLASGKSAFIKFLAPW